MSDNTYINDSLGNTWTLSIVVGPIGSSPARLGVRNLGTGFAVPPAIILNASDGSTAHSYRIDVDITVPARPKITEIAYDASRPLYVTMIDFWFQTWYLQITADPRFYFTKIFVPPPPPPKKLPGPAANLYAVIPMIVYPSSVTGLAQDANSPLYFKRQPRKMPYLVYEAIRHDNRASSGVQEVIHERTDKFFEGEMEYVSLDPLDIQDWDAFLQVALTGQIFDFYPDRLNAPTTFTTFFMDDQKISAAYKQANQYTFKLRWYQYVAWQ